MDFWITVFLFLSILFGGRWAGILFHELGHLLAVILCGWKPLEVKVGGGRHLWSFMIGDLQFCGTIFPVSGLVRACARESAYFRRKSLIFALSGPLMTTAVIGTLWFLSQQVRSSAPVWLNLCLLLLILDGAILLILCVVPHMVKIDGTLIPNDMLQAWRSATMKRKLVKPSFLGNVVGEASIYLARGQNQRAHALIESFAGEFAAADLPNAKILWIYCLLSDGKKGEADRVKEALLKGTNTADGPSTAILDSLACLPLYYGLSSLLEESIGYIELAIQKEPDAITLKGTKGSILIELGRLEEGMNLIDEVAASSQSENDRAICHYYKALGILKSGDRTAARLLLREAVAKYPACIVKSRIEKMFWNDPD